MIPILLMISCLQYAPINAEHKVVMNALLPEISEKVAASKSFVDLKDHDHYEEMIMLYTTNILWQQCNKILRQQCNKICAKSSKIDLANLRAHLLDSVSQAIDQLTGPITYNRLKEGYFRHRNAVNALIMELVPTINDKILQAKVDNTDIRLAYKILGKLACDLPTTDLFMSLDELRLGIEHAVNTTPLQVLIDLSAECSGYCKKKRRNYKEKKGATFTKCQTSNTNRRDHIGAKCAA